MVSFYRWSGKRRVNKLCVGTHGLGGIHDKRANECKYQVGVLDKVKSKYILEHSVQ